jgi:hypothetical protein
VKAWIFSSIGLSLIGSALGAQATLRGDTAAVAMARAMVERLGGREVWAAAKTLHIVEEVHRPDVRLPYRSETWRSFDAPMIWGRSSSSEIERRFARTQTSGWNSDAGVVRLETPMEHRRWLGYWPLNIYVMYHRLAREDTTLWIASVGERRFTVLDAATSAHLGSFGVTVSGEIVSWRASYALEEEEWIYGPSIAFGAIRMPAWGTRLGDRYRFHYREVLLTDRPPPVSYEPPTSR